MLSPPYEACHNMFFDVSGLHVHGYIQVLSFCRTCAEGLSIAAIKSSYMHTLACVSMSILLGLCTEFSSFTGFHMRFS